MAAYAFARTPTLDVGYLEWNPGGERAMLLLHGWPDSAETWKHVAPGLAAKGYRVIAPAMRGHAPTQFRDPAAMRSGDLAAMGRDLLDFLDAMRIEKPVLAGHDWGARAVANACGLRPGVASHLVMMSVGYGTNDPSQPLSLEQARRYWYHWYMATPRGERTVREDGRAFARIMWDTWSPPGWYDEADFDEAARAFDNPDWAEADVTPHSYRQRWGHAPANRAYAADAAMLVPAPVLAVPTLVIHGGADTVNHPDTSSAKERFFSGAYLRVVLDGIGHFPQREAPERVQREIQDFCAAP
jgi:pimeloyl-ACP methyl ester carboxylesterase